MKDSGRYSIPFTPPMIARGSTEDFLRPVAFAGLICICSSRRPDICTAVSLPQITQTADIELKLSQNASNVPSDTILDLSAGIFGPGQMLICQNDE